MKNRRVQIQTALLLLLSLSFSMIAAQEVQTEAPDRWHLQVAPTYNYLYSTHGTKFRGFGINIEAPLSARVQAGLGIERIYCPYHYDNGWNLSDLHLVPLYGMIRYHITEGGRIRPYVKAALGISFMRYNQQKARTTEPTVSIHSSGLYCYGGPGTTVAIKKGIYFFVEMGLVGYKMSFRALDINPHGVTGKTGVLFTL